MWKTKARCAMENEGRRAKGSWRPGGAWICSWHCLPWHRPVMQNNQKAPRSSSSLLSINRRSLLFQPMSTTFHERYKPKIHGYAPQFLFLSRSATVIILITTKANSLRWDTVDDPNSPTSYGSWLVCQLLPPTSLHDSGTYWSDLWHSELSSPRAVTPIACGSRPPPRLQEAPGQDERCCRENLCPRGSSLTPSVAPL